MNRRKSRRSENKTWDIIEWMKKEHKQQSPRLKSVRRDRRALDVKIAVASNKLVGGKEVWK